MAYDPEYCKDTGDEFHRDGHGKSRRYCSNCGILGHTISRCKIPITSYGIIALQRLQNDETDTSTSICWPKVKVLLIRRKDSLSFVDFVRGKYNTEDDRYIKNLFSQMTQGEHSLIQTMTFSELWNHVWGNSTKVYNNDFTMSERKYNTIKPTFPTFFLNGTIWKDPEWGFPKGRKNHNESDIDCALREFHEETNIDKKCYTLVCITDTPLVELFHGSDNIQYCHKYYIIMCNKDVKVDINKSSYHMQQEVGDIGWFEPLDAVNKLRKDMVEKIKVLYKAVELIESDSSL